MIELNPRYGQQNALAERVGMSFLVLEYNDVCGLAVAPITTFRTGVKWISFGSDIQTVRGLLKTGDLSFSDWWSSLPGDLCRSDFSSDDPGPGFWVVGQILTHVLVPRAAAEMLRRDASTSIEVHSYQSSPRTLRARLARRAEFLTNPRLLDRMIRASDSTPWTEIRAF